MDIGEKTLPVVLSEESAAVSLRCLGPFTDHQMCQETARSQLYNVNVVGRKV